MNLVECLHHLMCDKKFHVVSCPPPLVPDPGHASEQLRHGRIQPWYNTRDHVCIMLCRLVLIIQRCCEVLAVLFTPQVYALEPAPNEKVILSNRHRGYRIN